MCPKINIRVGAVRQIIDFYFFWWDLLVLEIVNHRWWLNGWLSVGGYNLQSVSLAGIDLQSQFPTVIANGPNPIPSLKRTTSPIPSCSHNSLNLRFVQSNSRLGFHSLKGRGFK